MNFVGCRPFTALPKDCIGVLGSHHCIVFVCFPQRECVCGEGEREAKGTYCDDGWRGANRSRVPMWLEGRVRCRGWKMKVYCGGSRKNGNNFSAAEERLH